MNNNICLQKELICSCCFLSKNTDSFLRVVYSSNKTLQSEHCQNCIQTNISQKEKEKILPTTQQNNQKRQFQKNKRIEFYRSPSIDLQKDELSIQKYYSKNNIIKRIEKGVKDSVLWSSLGVQLRNNEKIIIGKKNSNEQSKIKCYLKALEIDPFNQVTWNNLGNLVHNKKVMIKQKEQSARDCYLRSINLENSQSQSWNGLGSVINSKEETRVDGQMQTQQKCQMRALECDPNNYLAMNNLAKTIGQGCSLELRNLREKSKQTMSQIDCFLAAVHINPDQSYGWSDLALARKYAKDQQNSDEIIELFKKALQLDDANPYSWLGIADQMDGGVASINGSTQTKLECIAKSLTQDPDNSHAWYLAAQLMIQTTSAVSNNQKLTIGKQSQSVKSCLLKSIECDKDNTDAYKMLTSIYDDNIEENEKDDPLYIELNISIVNEEIYKTNQNMGNNGQTFDGVYFEDVQKFVESQQIQQYKKTQKLPIRKRRHTCLQNIEKDSPQLQDFQKKNEAIFFKYFDGDLNALTCLDLHNSHCHKDASKEGDQTIIETPEKIDILSKKEYILDNSLQESNRYQGTMDDKTKKSITNHIDQVSSYLQEDPETSEKVFDMTSIIYKIGREEYDQILNSRKIEEQINEKDVLIYQNKLDNNNIQQNSAVRNDPLENLINVKIDQETKNKINQIYNNGKKLRVSDKALLETLRKLYPELIEELDISLTNLNSFIKYIDPYQVSSYGGNENQTNNKQIRGKSMFEKLSDPKLFENNK